MRYTSYRFSSNWSAIGGIDGDDTVSTKTMVSGRISVHHQNESLLHFAQNETEFEFIYIFI